MARGHPNGNQDLEVDDTAFVESMQQNDEKLKQRHTDGQTADVCQFMAYLIGCQTALEKAFSDKNKDVPARTSQATLQHLATMLRKSFVGIFYAQQKSGQSHIKKIELRGFDQSFVSSAMVKGSSFKRAVRPARHVSMVINTGAFSGVFFLGPGEAGLYGVLMILSGIGFGAGLALPSAIQADVSDYNRLLTGQRREARYIGLWSIAIISFYPISEEKHTRIRREIAHREHSPS